MEIVEGIHKVDGVNANVYLVTDEKELKLIDTGMPRNGKKILTYVQRLNRQPSDISQILLTHCHIDHVGSAYELKKLTNAKIGIHQDDVDFVAGKKTMPTPKGIPGMLFKAASLFFKFTPVQPDMTLKENDTVGRLMVIHTPGHTPGSISLYDRTRRVLFAGDAVRFANGKITGPRERMASNPGEAKQSIKKISQLDFDVMLSGHGEPLIPNASDRIKEFYGSSK
jgi:hydroxyacylglutathione hydrolase